MIGFYNYTVILTYMSLISAITGMTFAHAGVFGAAIFCLALSGFFDMFDGKVARTKKDRTEAEKRFGIQIDSLADIVCFGVSPAILCYRMGMRGLTGVAILLFYVLAGLIRLAWFNVSEEVRQDETEEKRKYYQGLPITSMAVLLPLLAVFKPMLGKREFMLSLHALVLLVGLLFITNFNFRKPKNRTLAIIVGVVTLAVLRMLHIW